MLYMLCVLLVNKHHVTCSGWGRRLPFVVATDSDALGTCSGVSVTVRDGPYLVLTLVRSACRVYTRNEKCVHYVQDIVIYYYYFISF